MGALISNDKLKPGESDSSFCKQWGEQGLLCVCNISHLFLASSIWLVRSLEPRLKHVLSKCYPDLPKLCTACSNAHPKEAELMVHGNLVLVLYARVQITMCPHLLQHFFLGGGMWKSVKYALSSFDPKNISGSYFLADAAPVPFPVILHLGFYLHSAGIKSQFPVFSIKTTRKNQPKPSSLAEPKHYPNHCKETTVTVPWEHPSFPALCKLQIGAAGETSWSCREINKSVLFVRRACSVNAMSSYGVPEPSVGGTPGQRGRGASSSLLFQLWDGAGGSSKGVRQGCRILQEEQTPSEACIYPYF